MNSTPIVWPLRFWFLVELFFALSAISTVALRPAETATHFAWNIQPPVVAALFGAFYLALGPVVLWALFAKSWEQVRVFVLPGFVFTSAQLLVTFLHWERFLHGTLGFEIWFASYLLPPPVFLGCYLWQQRAAGRASFSPSQPLAGWMRRVAFSFGALLTLTALAGLVVPALLATGAPWKVTPLNARALAGYLLLLGTLLLSTARENDRRRARLVAPFFVLLLPVLAMQLLRFPEAAAWAAPWLVALLGILVPIAGLGWALLRGGTSADR